MGISSGPTPPSNPATGDLWVRSDSQDLPTCKQTGTHTVTEVVRYIDGSIVGYCTDCEVRVEVTHVKGGVDSQILKQIAVSVLGNELPGDDRFLDMLKAAEENYEELGEVLKIARWVRDERS